MSFLLNMGERLNLNHPVSFQEKLQWLKLYNRNDVYTRMVDKFEVREYVSNIIGGQYLIPLLGVWNDATDIDIGVLPENFVLKTTHDSGGVFICNKSNEDNITDAIKVLNDRLKNKVFYRNREWPYKNIVPRIIAETYLTDESGVELKDYKFFCFNGKVKLFKLDYGRFSKHHANYYDLDWNLLPFCEKKCPSNKNKKFCKPKNFELMVAIAEKLSSDIPFLRVDLYNINGEIYFGELTFYPDSGMGTFIPRKWNTILGSYLKLPYTIA
jgi:hypothetical protein